ncbi:energy-coupling factor transporter transmembrane protein EcfT [bacterium LRH843]|nr:energy-coupling factor transporter transmembrane protein EcfT [bacterium LRH843]
MLQNVIIGQYVQAASLLHRLDPRSKLVGVSILVFIIFLANNWLANGIIIFFTIAMVFLSKVPISFLLKGMKLIFWFVLLTIFVHLFMTREGNVLFSIGPFSIYDQGLNEGAFIAVRLLTLIILTSLVTLTTRPIDLTDGLESLFNPLTRIGVPAHELALMISIALRFIPTFTLEAEKIMKAQMARGVDFTSGPLLERLKGLFPLLIPLFISAFKRAEDLAVAMESRGYRGAKGRTKYRLLVWTWRDSAVIGVCLGLGLLILLLRFF